MYTVTLSRSPPLPPRPSRKSPSPNATATSSPAHPTPLQHRGRLSFAFSPGDAATGVTPRTHNHWAVPLFIIYIMYYRYASYNIILYFNVCNTYRVYYIPTTHCTGCTARRIGHRCNRTPYIWYKPVTSTPETSSPPFIANIILLLSLLVGRQWAHITYYCY